MAQVLGTALRYSPDGSTWQDVGFLTGINLGVVKPGFEPGEQPLTKYVAQPTQAVCVCETDAMEAPLAGDTARRQG